MPRKAKPGQRPPPFAGVDEATLKRLQVEAEQAHALIEDHARRARVLRHESEWWLERADWAASRPMLRSVARIYRARAWELRHQAARLEQAINEGRKGG